MKTARMRNGACMRCGASTPCGKRCNAGWGALRYASNAAALTMMYAQDILRSPYLTPGVRAYAAQLFNYVSLPPWTHRPRGHGASLTCMHAQHGPS